jgi:NAD(P)-dependent dehydrogenase (short-subunit alcohol dehydrogenase family)
MNDLKSTGAWPGIAGARILVTGASSGLGMHFARMFAAQGAVVTAAARRRDRIDALCAEIIADGGKADAMEMDVADSASVKSAMSGKVFDVVINNAGTTLSAPALKHEAEDFQQILGTNANGAFNVAKAAAQAMIDAGQGGVIINVASILAHRVAGGVSAYTTSKAAVLQLTKALALEWARYGIRVNALCPGYIETDLNRDFFETEAGKKLISRVPQRRLGQPTDLDGAMLLLASDLSQFMTGADIVVDGGHLVSSL